MAASSGRSRWRILSGSGSAVWRDFSAVVLDRGGGDGVVSGAGVSAGACLSRERGSGRICICSLVILPFWTSFLIRTYAWMFLLRDTGLINTALFRLRGFMIRCRCCITMAR